MKIEGFNKNGERCFLAENLSYELAREIMQTVKFAQCVQTPTPTETDEHETINAEDKDSSPDHNRFHTAPDSGKKTALDTAFEQLDTKIAEITTFLNTEKAKIEAMNRLSEDRRSGSERRDYRVRGRE